MTTTHPSTKLTEEKYLAVERQAEEKSEYLGGEMFAMAGANREHNLIVTNLVINLGLQLKNGPCRVYSNDMRLKVRQSGLYTYPDVMVVCEEEHFLDGRRDTLLNPLLIIEVLSESTEVYDRGKKFGLYRALETLEEYLLVTQTPPRIEQYVRQEDGRWLFSEAEGIGSDIILPSIGVTLGLSDVYDKVEWKSVPDELKTY